MKLNMLALFYGLTLFLLVLPTAFSESFQDNWSSRANEIEAQEGNGTEVAETTTKRAEEPTTKRPRDRACSCNSGKCKCCSGALMQALNFPINQKLCVDVLYIPEEFEFEYNLNFNERVLYRNKISGKNPRPLCIPLSRFLPVNVCLKFSNIYMMGRNVHACLDVEGSLFEAEILDVSFECFRLGTSGIAFLRPEDGGGLPEPIQSQSPSSSRPLDYDDSA